MRVGTRSSAMALAQTTEVARLLREAHPGLDVSVERFQPTGDVDQISKLERHGGKGGAFVSEIRDAMRAGSLDCAMHSLKDMPGDEEAPGLVIGAYLARDTAADALVLRPGLAAAEVLANGAAGLKIGTNAVRRAAYLRRLFPKAEVIHFRGAADTRLKKLDERIAQRMPDGSEAGPADALVMARSGLERIGRGDRVDHVFTPDEMLPAIGQGIVAVECPATAWETRARLARIDIAASRIAAEAEREALWILNGHCNSPIAGHASIEGEALRFKAAVIDLYTDEIVEVELAGTVDRPRELGRAVGFALLDKGAAAIIEKTRE